MVKRSELRSSYRNSLPFTLAAAFSDAEFSVAEFSVSETVFWWTVLMLAVVVYN